MKRKTLYFVLFALIFIMACVGLPGGKPAATSTPEPTFTSLPTETPTLVPTATPNSAATASARATQVADDILAGLDSLLGDSDIPYQDGYLAWKHDDALTISMTGPDSKVLEVDNRLTASNFVLKSEVTWLATGVIACGAVFRSEPDLLTGGQYQFLFMRFSGLPAWAIEYHDNGYFKNSPTDVKFSEALSQENNATNEFILVAQDEQFTMYINGVRQGRFFDYSKQRNDGSFGFLGVQDSGKGSCKYENSWIWSLDPWSKVPTAWNG